MYKSQTSSGEQIWHQVYVENGENMGIEGWTIGAYHSQDAKMSCTGFDKDSLIALCDICDVQSNYKIDPPII